MGNCFNGNSIVSTVRNRLTLSEQFGQTFNWWKWFLLVLWYIVSSVAWMQLAFKAKGEVSSGVFCWFYESFLCWFYLTLFRLLFIFLLPSLLGPNSGLLSNLNPRRLWTKQSEPFNLFVIEFAHVRLILRESISNAFYLSFFPSCSMILRNLHLVGRFIRHSADCPRETAWNISTRFAIICCFICYEIRFTYVILLTAQKKACATSNYSVMSQWKLISQSSVGKCHHHRLLQIRYWLVYTDKYMHDVFICPDAKY